MRENQIEEYSCWCSCLYSINNLCGCSSSFLRIYQTRTHDNSTMIIGTYSGCFKHNQSYYEFKKTLGFMTNDACIQICIQKEFKYAMTQHQ